MSSDEILDPWSTSERKVPAGRGHLQTTLPPCGLSSRFLAVNKARRQALLLELVKNDHRIGGVGHWASAFS
jgi:hypothetical protein